MHDILVNIVQPCALAIISTCAPIIAYAILRKLGLQNDANANAVVTTAINRSAGVALNYGIQKADPLLTNAETKSAALSSAINYVNQSAGPQLARLKVDQDAIATKVASQLALTLNAAPAQPATLAFKTVKD